MSAFAAAQYARLTGDAALVALLGTYQSLPCVFLEDDHVPPGAPRPYVWAPGPVGDAPWDQKRELGRDLLVDFWCVTDRSAAPRLVGDLAEMVRTLFHRRPLDVVGYGTVLAVCTGPVVGESDETVRARIVTARWLLTAL